MNRNAHIFYKGGTSRIKARFVPPLRSRIFNSAAVPDIVDTPGVHSIASTSKKMKNTTRIRRYAITPILFMVHAQTV